MNNKAHLRPKDYDSNGDIIPMACKEEKGDLISRSALLKTVEEERQYLLAREQTGAEHILVHNFLPLIDKAPTIPLPDFKEGYKQAIIDGKTNYSRPQGVWEPNSFQFECNLCENLNAYKSNFCPNCGAKMKGGAE